MESKCGSEKVCSICLEETGSGETGIYKCPNGHKHHMRCIGKWCERYNPDENIKPQCPCCKCPLPQNKEDWVLINKEDPFYLNIKTGDRGWYIPMYVN